MGKTQTCKRNSRRSLGRIETIWGREVIGDGESGSLDMPKEPLSPSPMTPFPLVKNKKTHYNSVTVCNTIIMRFL